MTVANFDIYQAIEGELFSVLVLSNAKHRDWSTVVQVSFNTMRTPDFDPMVAFSHGVEKVAISTKVPCADM